THTRHTSPQKNSMEFLALARFLSLALSSVRLVFSCEQTHTHTHNHTHTQHTTIHTNCHSDTATRGERTGETKSRRRYTFRSINVPARLHAIFLWCFYRLLFSRTHYRIPSADPNSL